MADDGALKDHQTWLAYLQPEGLVVSPAALVDSQVVLDRAQLARIQQNFLPFTTDADVDDKTVTILRSLPEFLCEFLGWSKESLLGAGTNVPIPDQLIVDLPEFGETLRPDFVLCDAKPADPERPWLILIKELPFGAALDDAAYRSRSAMVRIGSAAVRTAAARNQSADWVALQSDSRAPDLCTSRRELRQPDLPGRRDVRSGGAARLSAHCTCS